MPAKPILDQRVDVVDESYRSVIPKARIAGTGRTQGRARMLAGLRVSALFVAQHSVDGVPLELLGGERTRLIRVLVGNTGRPS